MLQQSEYEWESSQETTLDLLVFTPRGLPDNDGRTFNGQTPVLEPLDHVASQPTETEESAEHSADKASHRSSPTQSIALTILATLAVLYTTAAAGAILFPLTLAVLLALTLRPVVRWGERRHVPPLITSLGLLLAMILFVSSGIVLLIEPAQTWLGEAPKRLAVVGDKLSRVRDRINEVYVVSEQLENLANGETEESATQPQLTFWQRATSLVSADADTPSPVAMKDAAEPIAVEVRQPRLMANLTALSSVSNYVGTLLITLVLAFFLLVEGDMLLTNTIRILPRWSDKKNAVRLLQRLEVGISQYLLTISLINVGLGVVVAGALWLMGVPNAGLWGLMATVLNFIPFLGALIGVVVLFLVAVFSFDSLAYASLVPVVFLLLTTIEGNFLTPMLVGRTVSVNSVAVLLSLILWGWLWGIGGALIGVPLLIIFKLICDQFERTAPIGELLSGR